MKRFLIIVLSIVAVLAAVVLGRAAMHGPTVQPLSKTVDPVSVDKEALINRMSESVRFKTISFQSKDQFQADQFEGYIQWLIESYPEVQQAMTLTMISDYTMLYRWQGSDPSLKPVLLTGHYDVVPVIPGTESKWTHPPFEGVVSDGYVWGRGSLDDKSAIVSLLQAASQLIQAGYQPTRTIYFSFGHDEEIGGPEGAGGVVKYANEHNLSFLWSLDEGSFLFKDMIPGVDQLMGTINVAEKGSTTLDIVAKAAGGHSSMPPLDNAVGVLASALVKLEQNPVPGGLDGLSAESFDGMSRYMPFGMKVLFANQWLFKGLLESELYKTTFLNASLRTTTAPTMLSASTKVNVLPIEAVATVNFRLHPRDTPESVKAHVERVINDDRVEVRSRGGRNASEVSDSNGEGYRALELAVREVRQDAFVTPGLMIAGSDSRHYGKIADNAYRFNPQIVTAKDLPKIHGTDENISIDNLVLATQVYTRLMLNL